MKKILLTCFALAIAFYALAQERTVSGKVTSTEDGSPLPGVNVIVKGTTTGTATDAEGKFSLSVSTSGGSLVFSFIGLESKEIEIGDRTIIDVSLALDITQLSEVVVTAFGIERDKKSLGYGVTTIKNEALTTARTTNLVNALQGKIPGVRISSSNGMTGSGSAIFIRGFTTFTGSNQPLFVIDGIPIDNSGGGTALQNGVSNSNRAIDVNQDDIESISVLKGPSAAVLYGSRAASGAIIITTKKGKSGAKNVIDYNASYNVVEANTVPEWQNEYAQGAAGVFNANSNLSWGPQIAGQTVTNYLGDQEQLTAYPNNIKDIFKSGYNVQNTVTFSTGTEKNSYLISYGNLKETGILDNNELNRHNFRINTSQQLSKILTAGASVQYVLSNSQRTQIGNQLSNPFFRGWFIPRNINVQGNQFEDANENQLWYDATDHPYWTIKHNTWEDEINRVIGNFYVSIDPTPWLNINYKVGGDFWSQVQKGYDQIGARGQANVSAQGAGGILDVNQDSKDLYSYFNVTFKKEINDDFDISALVGNEIVRQTSKFNQVIGRSIVIRDYKNISNALNYFPAITESESRLTGVYADLTLGYKGFLTVNLTGRNDWSSTFSKGNRSYFYPSIATSFVFTDAFETLRNNNILSFGKVRANYAKVGRQAPLYSTDTYFVQPAPGDGFGPVISFPFNGLAGRTYSNGAGNPDVGPEFTQNTEFGIELGFLDRRINLDVTYFDQRTTDIILNVPVPGSSGVTSALKNAGELSNKGIELAINATPVKGANFVWDLNMNFTKLDSKVEKLASGVDNIFLGGFTTPNIRLVEGERYGIIFGTAFERDANGKMVIIDSGPNAGRPRVAAVGRNLGDTNPDWTMGITNTLNYKGIALSFLIDIRQGGDVISRNIGDLRRSGAAKETAEFPRFESDGITPTTPYIIDGVKATDGSTNDIPISAEAYWGSLYQFGIAETYIFDASWVRLREASISYSLPSSILQKTPLGKLQIGVNGRNLFLNAPNFPHLDPETNALGVSNAQGFEFNALPQARTYGVFLKATF